MKKKQKPHDKYINEQDNKNKLKSYLNRLKSEIQNEIDDEKIDESVVNEIIENVKKVKETAEFCEVLDCDGCSPMCAECTECTECGAECVECMTHCRTVVGPYCSSVGGGSYSYNNTYLTKSNYDKAITDVNNLRERFFYTTNSNTVTQGAEAVAADWNDIKNMLNFTYYYGSNASYYKKPYDDLSSASTGAAISGNTKLSTLYTVLNNNYCKTVQQEYCKVVGP